jgi:hypothetical protein
MVDDAETLCARLDKLDRLVKLAQLNQSGDDRARMERSSSWSSGHCSWLPSIVVDHRARGPNGTWLPALPSNPVGPPYPGHCRAGPDGLAANLGL